jgi:hypothetical protein
MAYVDEPPPDPNAAPPPDVNIPTISVKDGWSDGPPLIVGGDPAPSTAPPPSLVLAEQLDLLENGPQTPPAHGPFQVVLGAAKDVESSLLAKVRDAVNQYEPLRQYVASVAPWIFFARTPKDAQYGRAKPTQDSKDAVAVLDNTMLGGADAVHLAGLFVSQIDQSLQAYAHADRETLFPPP